jgi:hypothetical protein
MLMVTSMKESGERIKHTEKVNILMITELSMMATGNTISNMGLALKAGLMEPNTKANLLMARKKAKVFLSLLTAVLTKENSAGTKSTILELTDGVMAKFTLVNGKIIR